MERTLNRRLPILFATVMQFTVEITFTMLLQFRLRELGASVFVISLIATVRGAMMVIGSPVWGSVADQMQYTKRLLVSLMTMSGLLFMVYVFLGLPLQFVILTSIVSFITSGFIPIALVMSTASTDESLGRSAREISFFNAAGAIGMFQGGILMSLLLLMISVQMTMLVFALLMFVAVLPALFVKETKKSEVRRASGSLLNRILPIVSDFSPMKRNGLWALYIGVFMRQFGIAGITALAAVYMTEEVGLTSSGAALLSSINPGLQFFSHLYFGRLIVKIGPKKSTVLGMFLSSLTAILFGLAGNWITVSLAYLSLGFAYGAFINGAATFVAINAPRERRTEFQGLLRSFRAFGLMFGPITAGYIAEYSYFAMFLFLAAIMAASGLLFFVFGKEKQMMVV